MPEREAPITVRAPLGSRDEFIGRLDRAAGCRGMTRNAWILRCLEVGLAAQHEDDELPPEAHALKESR